MICARIVGIPIILYGEGTTLKRLGWRKRMIYQGIKNIILRLYFLNINAFLPVGNLCTAFYSNYGIRLSKMFRTPYCLDSVYFEERMKDDRPYRDRTRYELGINNDITAVFVAKLIPRKRPFDLLKAYVRMKYRDKMSLIFIGDGFLQKEMERFIEDKKLKKIHMVGFKNQSELSKYYMASDFAVLPSEYETWGLAVNEAMIHSLPVLTTNMVGSAYDLINPETGWRYPVGDIDKLSKILDNIIESPESCKSMGIAAKTLVSKYNIPACVDGIIRAIEYISKGRKK
jgi:glycosyltransferase involved in cell wall biosynthesis